MSEIDKGRHVHRLLDTAIADKDGKVIYKAGKNRGKPKKYSASTVAELLGISKSYVTKLNRIYLAYKQGVPDIPDDNAAEDYTAKYFNDGEINKQQLTTDLTAKLATITAKMDLATKDDYETITKEIDATRQILGLLKQQINNSTEVTSSKQYVILNARIDKTQAKIDDLKVKLEEATTPKAKLAISSRLTKAEAKLAILKGKAEGYKKVSFYK
jgi:hypothetical protein